jgi:transcriptional regulator with XRE-family HTH domain
LVNDAAAIHERIIVVRKALGLSQKEFGKGINVSQGYFSNIELKQRKVNDRIIGPAPRAKAFNFCQIKHREGNLD